jgi:membrane-associated phospholipid phosphatase
MAALYFPQGLNLAAYQAVANLGSLSLYHIMSYFLESYLVVVPLVFLYLLYKKDRNAFIFAAAFLILYVISDIIKMIVKEPRPCSFQGLQYLQGYCDTGYSFPSNHATILTGLFIFINHRYVKILYLVWVILLLFGKLLLAQHYLTDIVAGAVISLIVAGLLKIPSKRINNVLAGLFNRLFGRIYRL